MNRLRQVIYRFNWVRQTLVTTYGIFVFWNRSSAFAKRRLISRMLSNSPRSIAIETGTYLGDTTKLLSKMCTKVFTVEFSSELATRAKCRFSSHPNVEVLLGDSASCLEEILSAVDDNVFFWLDAHCSAGITAGDVHKSPLLAEIMAISNWSNGKKFTVAVDDADYLGSPGYPDLETVMAAFPRHTAGMWSQAGTVLIFDSAPKKVG